MPKNVTVSLPDELYTRMERMPEINWSEVARKSFAEYIEGRENREKTELVKDLEKYRELVHRYGYHSGGDFSWRTIGYKDSFVTVNAKLGQFGPTDWTLEVKSRELEKPLAIELGGMPQLDRTIRGVADYFNHINLKSQGIELSKTVTKEVLSDLWIGIGKWARKNKVEILSDVALLPSESFSVRGIHNLKEFDSALDGDVTPKEWGNVKKDEGEINVFFSNFWISHGENGATFRLSSYLTKQIGISSAKNATRYIDFNPDNQEHEREIKKLLSKASVIYLPDLSVKNVRSVFF